MCFGTRSIAPPGSGIWQLDTPFQHLGLCLPRIVRRCASLLAKTIHAVFFSFFVLLWTTEHVNSSKRDYSCITPQPTAAQQHHKQHHKYMTDLNSAIAALNLVFHWMDSFWNTRYNLSWKGWGLLDFFPYLLEDEAWERKPRGFSWIHLCSDSERQVGNEGWDVK